MKKIVRTIVITAMFILFAGAVPVQAHPSNCPNMNNCTMNGNGCYMQEGQKTCVKQGCDNARCQNSKYCEQHKVKRVEPKNKSWGHHGHHGK